MQKLLRVFLIAVALRAGDDKPITGHWYKGLAESNRIAYVYGYMEGYSMGIRFATNQFVRILQATMSENTRKMFGAEIQTASDEVKDNLGPLCLWRPGEHTTSGQMTAILDKYITDHPERWDKPLNELSEEAFTEACEKRAKKP